MLGTPLHRAETHRLAGVCQVLNLSRKYESELKQVDENSLLPQTELGILQTLYTEGRPTRVTSIAGELDCSYQLVGKRGKILADRGLVTRSQNEQGKRVLVKARSAEPISFLRCKRISRLAYGLRARKHPVVHVEVASSCLPPVKEGNDTERATRR